MGKGMEQLHMDRETVIRTPKHRLVETLADIMVNESDRVEFRTLCGRLESTIRSMYTKKFARLLRCYHYFDPIEGPKRMAKDDLDADKIQAMEIEFLDTLFGLLEKSSFKVLSDEEYRIATSANYRLNLPISVDTKKIDNRLLTRFFEKRPDLIKDLPSYGKHYLVFRQGVGVDRHTDLFAMEKVNVILAKLWFAILSLVGLKKREREDMLQSVRAEMNRSIQRRQSQIEREKQEQHAAAAAAEAGDRGSSGDASPLLGGEPANQPSNPQQVSFERIRLENIPLSLKMLVTPTTIQEPTFNRILVLYRPLKGAPPKPKAKKEDKRILTATQAAEKAAKERAERAAEAYKQSAIVIRQFEGIPMADIEITLPEKKTPGLTPLDWVKMAATAVGGLAALGASLKTDELNTTLIVAIVTAVLGYISKVYFSWTAAMRLYNNLITAAVYEKQLDSGMGTLLTLCDAVMEQEVKEAVVAFYMLMTQGKANLEELDERCEDLLAEEFDEVVDFDVADACGKLLRLGIITQDASGRFVPPTMKKANATIGTTTDELVEVVLGKDL